MVLKRYLIILLCLQFSICWAQQRKFSINGEEARDLGDYRYQLTADGQDQYGTVWHDIQVDLSKSFILVGKFNLGSNQFGADGMGFGFQQDGISAGDVGEGLGLQGIEPSYFLEFDTYPNDLSRDETYSINDDYYDHIAIHRDGNFAHDAETELVTQRRFLPGRDEMTDGKDYRYKFTWNAETQVFKVFIDCQERISHQIDLVNEIFGGDPMAYWGFGAATGGLTNKHEVQIEYFTTVLEPKTICRGAQVIIGDEHLENMDDLSFQWAPRGELFSPNRPTTVVGPTETTTYQLAISDTCGIIDEIEATVNVIEELELEIVSDLPFVCPGDTVLLSANYEEIRWEDGSTDLPRAVASEGVYSAETTNPACNSSDAIRVPSRSLPEGNFLPADTFVCEDGSIPIQVATGTNQLNWVDGSAAPTRNLGAGDYIAVLRNQCGETRDTLSIVELATLGSFLPNDTALCPGSILPIDLENVAFEVEWNDGEVTNARGLEPGLSYTATISNECGAFEDRIEIQALAGFEAIDFGVDTSICQDSVLLNFETVPYTIQWSDGQTGNQRWFSDGAITGSISNSCGDTSGTIRVNQLLELPSKLLPADTSICSTDAVPINLAALPIETLTWSDGQSDANRSLSPGTYRVEAINTCSSIRDSITISEIAVADILLPNDTIICSGASIELQPLVENVTWDDGASFERELSEGVYYASLNTVCAMVEDSIMVTLEETLPTAFLPADTTICPTDNITIPFPPDFSWSVQWADGHQGNSRNVGPGTYVATLRNACEQVENSIQIDSITRPSSQIFPPDTSLCLADSIFFEAPIQDPLVWSDNFMGNDRFLKAGDYQAFYDYGCGVISDRFFIAIEAEPERRFLPADSILCFDETIDISVPALDKHSISWSDGNTSWNREISGDMFLTARIQGPCGVYEDDIDMLEIPAIPTTFLPNDTILCLGEYITFDPMDVDDGSFVWSDTSISIERQMFAGEQYEATLSNECGTETDNVSIKIKRGCSSVSIPNIFSPDKRNNAFEIIDYDDVIEEILYIKIFNRWGALVYEANNIQPNSEASRWTGGNYPADVYIYAIDLRVKPGEIIHLSGDITLIR